MKKIISNALEGKMGDTLIFLTYVAVDINENNAHEYAMAADVKYQNVISHINQLARDGFLTRTSYGSCDWRMAITPEYFIEIAETILEEHKSRLEQVRKMRILRREEADFLWDVTEAYLYGKEDVGSMLRQSYPDSRFPDIRRNGFFSVGSGALRYLRRYVLTGRFDEWLKVLNGQDFHTLICGTLVESLNSDNAPEGMFDRISGLIRKWDHEGSWSTPYQVDFLIDLTNCYRYFYDGTVSKPSCAAPTYPYRVMLAIRALYQGNAVASVALFIEALKERNKSNKEKNVFGNGLMSFYLILAYRKLNTEDTNKKIQQFLNKKVVADSRELAPAAFLAHWVGSGQETNRLDNMVYHLWRSTEGVYEKYLAEIIAGYLDYLGPNQNGDDYIPQPDMIPDYALLKHELSPYLDIPQEEKDRLAALFGGSPVLTTIRKKERWESVLDDMSRLIAAQKESAQGQVDNRLERIGYFMNHDGRELEFRIQSRLKSGGWSAGKKAGQNDFFKGNIPCMDETDRKIAAAAKDYCYGSHVSSEDAFPHLIGSDKVYTYSPYEPVTIREEKPYISLKTAGARFVPGTNVPKDRRGVRHRVSIKKISRTEYSVIMLNDVQMKLLDSIMSLQTLPEHSSEYLSELLPALSKHIEVHSSLLEGGSSLANIEGETAVHIKIDPKSDEYLVEMYVLPLAGGQLKFKPGEGDKIVYDQRADGRYQVTRDLRTERHNLEEIADFLEDESLSPEMMLRLVEWASERPDRYVLEWPEGKKIRVYPVIQSSSGIGIKSGEGWFEVEGEIKLKDVESIKIQELLSLISKGNVTGNYIRLDDENYIALTDTLRKQMKRLEAISQLSRGKARISQFNIGALAEIVRGRQDTVVDGGYSNLLRRIEEASTLEPQIPEGLNAALRDYQYEGFRWMARLDHWGAGACLADDMGLGKTVQAIAFLLRKAADGPSLVVAPASVVLNWANELARFAPGLRVSLLNQASDRGMVIETASAGDVVLSTYGLLPQEEERLAKVTWNVVCLDEAHTIKNRQTKTSAATMSLNASSRIILTGTPVQNHLGEMWNLFQFLNPGLLGSFEQFSHKFITNENADLNSLRRIVQPFILRRTKSQVLDELPEKTDIIRNVELSDMEILAYEGLRERVESELMDENKVSVNALAEITRLRQAACSMSLVDKEWGGTCSKIECFKELVGDILSGYNRILVFSQFTSFLKLALHALDQTGIEYFYLDGSTPIKKREEMVKAFQKGERQIFVVSLKAGGLGLNLTGANYVIHLDPWWNPSIEQQATDRAHRIGQKQPVTVYHLISSHTIEEKILRLHKTKRDLADTFLSGADVAHTITMDDLRSLAEK